MKYWSVFLSVLILNLCACQFGDIDIDARFDRVSGLSKGDRVLFQGNPAGKVSSVKYHSDDRYQVKLSLDKGYAEALTEYSEFHLVDDPDREGHKAIQIRLSQKGGRMLSDGATVKGVSEPESVFGQWRKEIEKGLSFLEKQIEKYSEEIESFPESEEYQQLIKSLAAWAAEMERAGDQARDKVNKEWLPRVEKELDALRQWLREHGHEEQIKPFEQEVERIRNI